MKYIIYHNNRCSKSRCALEKLKAEGKEYEIVEYLKTPPTEEELAEILEKLGMKAEELLRKNEAVFKEKYKDKKLSETEWIQAMVKYPKLIERPIIVRGDKAVVGRPAEMIDKI